MVRPDLELELLRDFCFSAHQLSIDSLDRKLLMCQGDPKSSDELVAYRKD